MATVIEKTLSLAAADISRAAAGRSEASRSIWFAPDKNVALAFVAVIFCDAEGRYFGGLAPVAIGMSRPQQFIWTGQRGENLGAVKASLEAELKRRNATRLQDWEDQQ